MLVGNENHSVPNRIAELFRKADDDKIPENLSAKIPHGLISVREGRKMYAIENQVGWLVSIFMTMLVRKFSKQQSDFVSELFFNGWLHKFSGVGEQETPLGIKAWLARFYIERSRFIPCFVVEETSIESNFLLNIGVIDKEDSDGLVIPLSDIISFDEYRNVRFDALRNISLVSQNVANVDTYIDGGALKPINIAGEELLKFLLQTVPSVSLLQAKVVLPRSLKTLVRPKATINHFSNVRDLCYR